MSNCFGRTRETATAATAAAAAAAPAATAATAAFRLATVAITTQQCQAECE